MSNTIDHSINPSDSSSNIPVIGALDKHHWLFYAFIWLGICSLLPFNFFITADPYFRSQFQEFNQTNASTSEFALSYENVALLSAAVPFLLTTIAITLIFTRHLYKRWIYVCLCGMILCLAFCFGLTFIDLHDWRLILFICFMILVAIQSIFNAILFNCFFSLVSVLPVEYMQGFISGQSIAGVIVSLFSIISIAISSSASRSTDVYFSMTILALMSNIFIYYRLEKSSLFQIYATSLPGVRIEHEPLLQESSSFNMDDDVTVTLSLRRSQLLIIAYKKVKWNLWAIFVNYLATMLIYPAYLSKIRSAVDTHNEWTKHLFMPVMTFLLFNLGDTLGRLLTMKFQYPSSLHPRLLFLFCFLRISFIFLFGLCRFPNRNGYPYVFRHDIFYALLILLFSISHGFFSALAMIYAPKRVQTQLRHATGTLMLLALTSGICIGAALSFGVVTIYGVNQSKY